MESFDLIVIGGGPGGYVAALRAAQKGLKVACIDKNPTLGGTCLNVGCIPSKNLLHATELIERVQGWGSSMGIHVDTMKIDFSQMMKKKEEVVSRLVGGIASLFAHYKIQWFKGEGAFLSPTQVEINKSTQIEGKSIILATGSEPIPLPGVPFDESRILSSTGALNLKEIPKRMVIVGGGVIGLELGSVYHRLGTQIVVVEMLDRLCPAFDEEISKTLLQIFRAKKWEIHLSTQVQKIDTSTSLLKIQTSKEMIEADAVLVSIGRRPFTKGLALEKSGVQCDAAGRIPVNAEFRTSIPHIFAIGDVIEGPMLAHKASEEGIAVVDLITEGKFSICYPAIPNVMYTEPEVASIGLTQKQAEETGLEIAIGKFPFRANARARCSGEEEGLVKVIAEKHTGRLLGLHLLGPFVSEMAGEGSLAIQEKLSVQTIAHLPHAHPTYSEALKEAAMGVFGKRLHFL